MIRIEATDALGNRAFLFQQPQGSWGCTLANGTPASFSYAGIDHGEEAACRLALHDCHTREDALAVVLKHARRFKSGDRKGQTVFSYEAFGGEQIRVFVIARFAEDDTEDAFDGIAHVALSRASAETFIETAPKAKSIVQGWRYEIHEAEAVAA